MIVDITPSQVLVVPAPGQPGKIAFWNGDLLSRPSELAPSGETTVRPLAFQQTVLAAPLETMAATKAGKTRGAGVDEKWTGPTRGVPSKP